MSYSEEHLKLMRLAGMPGGYGISEVPQSSQNPSVYSQPREDSYKTPRDEIIPLTEYDFDQEVNAFVGSSTANEQDSELCSTVLSLVTKLQSVVAQAYPNLSGDEKAKVTLAISRIVGSL